MVAPGLAGFGTTMHQLTNRFIWYGTTKLFPTLSLTFRSHETGSYVAHHYRYSRSESTFIVECDAQTYAAAGFAGMEPDASRRLCETIFAADLSTHSETLTRSFRVFQQGSPILADGLQLNWRRVALNDDC